MPLNFLVGYIRRSISVGPWKEQGLLQSAIDYHKVIAVVFFFTKDGIRSSGGMAAMDVPTLTKVEIDVLRAIIQRIYSPNTQSLD